MRSLKVEFLPKRQVSLWLWRGLAAALMLLAAQQGWEAWRLREQVLAIEAAAARFAAQADQVTRAEEDAKARAQLKPPYYQDALAVAKLAGFPLQRVFAAIESAQVKGVRASAVDIDAANGTVKVELDLTSQEGLMEYLEAINAGEPQTRWLLVQAQTASSAGATGTAVISSQWVESER